jgi:hypothetical protein
MNLKYFIWLKNTLNTQSTPLITEQYVLKRVKTNDTIHCNFV